MEELPLDNRNALQTTQRLLSKARTGQLSTVSQLTDEDIANVWFSVAQFVAQCLSQGKGCGIPGLGTFSLSTVDERTPVFQLSESFAKANAVRAVRRPLIAGHIPVVTLNYSELARATQHERHVVEAVVTSILQALTSEIRDETKGQSPSGLSVMFFGVGKLSIRQGKVRFFFLKAFEENPTPMTLSSDTSDSLFSGRPATVGLVEHLSSLASPSGHDRLSTPRLLCTPTVRNVEFSLSGGLGATDRRQAWESDDGQSLSPSRTASRARSPRATSPLSPLAAQRSSTPVGDDSYKTSGKKEGAAKPIRWQSSLVNGGALFPIVDHADAQAAPHNDSHPGEATEARRVRPKPTKAIDESDVTDEQMKEYVLQHQRAINTSVHLVNPVEDHAGTVDEQAKRHVWDYKHGPQYVAEGKIPQTHKLDAQKTRERRNVSYVEWLQLQKEKGQQPTRTQTFVRDQLDKDDAIQRKLEQQEKERELYLHEQQIRAEKKAEAMEHKLQQLKLEDTRRIAQFNAQQATYKKPTDHFLDDDEDDQPGADVFVYRPATSKTEIKAVNQSLAIDLAAQAASRKIQEHRERKREFEESKRSREQQVQALKQSLAEEQDQAARAKQQYLHQLDAQIAYKQDVEQKFKRVHPRQPVPFDVKHLPATDDRLTRPNSALGRPAAALGPEMYREHDKREEKSTVLAAKVYAQQVEFQARRNRQAIAEASQEREKDQQEAEKAKEKYFEDLRNLKAMMKTNRKTVETDWHVARREKKTRDEQEMQHRKLPADAPMKEQMDYLAYLNGFE
eukprot:m.25051 g.25051  ORF g.25051 m.25051 type:complete len:790 (-) comp8673_c0_seq1:294-2663(-)